jgi:hypothetical protein
LRHYGYQNPKKYYNGATCDEINSSSALGIQGKPTPIIPAERKANKITSMVQTRVAGRGVLLDYVRWSKSQNKQFGLISGIFFIISSSKRKVD